MSEYVKVSDAKKFQLLQEHSFQAPFPTLDQKNWCLHCEKEFDGHSVRVWKDRDGSLWLECGTPGCDGSPIDWAPFPWWDSDHPLTREHEAEAGVWRCTVFRGGRGKLKRGETGDGDVVGCGVGVREIRGGLGRAVRIGGGEGVQASVVSRK